MPTDPTPRHTGFDLQEGPLADALFAVERALADIETAKATVTVRRHEFARVFRAEAAAHTDHPAFVDDLRATISELYWEGSALRVTDLAAATGLGNERIRSMAGPRVVDTPCSGCGAPTQVLQTRRGERCWGRCRDCRQPVPDPYADSGTWPPTARAVPPPPAGWLARLCEELELRLRTVDCDHQLSLTRRWAMREGIDVEATIASVGALGAHCDCEVLTDAASWRDRPL